MGFLWFRTKTHPKYGGHDLTDIDREASIETRQQNREIRKIQHETRKLEAEAQKLKVEMDIAEMRYQLYGDDEEEDEADGLLSTIFAKAGLNANSLSQAFQGHTPPAPVPAQRRTLTETELREVLGTIPPPVLKVARKLPREQLENELRTRYPDVDEETVQLAIRLIQG